MVAMLPDMTTEQNAVKSNMCNKQAELNCGMQWCAFNRTSRLADTWMWWTNRIADLSRTESICPKRIGNTRWQTGNPATTEHNQHNASCWYTQQKLVLAIIALESRFHLFQVWNGHGL